MQFRKYFTSKKILPILVLLGLFSTGFVIFYYNQNQSTVDLGVEELKEPNYYPTADESTILGIETNNSPTETKKFENTEYAFAFIAQGETNFDDLTFKIKSPGGNLSDKYIVEATDVFMGDEDKEFPALTSELYIFEQGVIEIQLFYEGDKNLEIKTYPYKDPKMPDAIGDMINEEDFASTNAEIEYKETLFSKLGFNIVTREEWGAPTESGWNPSIADINRIVIHHTATSVDMNNPKNTVKAIYDYHKNRCSNNVGSAPYNCDYSETWQDIGYNYLIDPYGNIYEGRTGGNGVVGAHAIPNTGSIGISLLGNFENQKPTEASMNSLINLMSRLGEVNNFKLEWQKSVFGHKDVYATACPGYEVYNRLPFATSLAQSRKGSNPLVAWATDRNNKLLSNTQIIQDNGYKQLIIKLDGLNNELKEKLITPSRGIDNIEVVDNTAFYSVPSDKVDQVLNETFLVAPESNVQPNFIYKVDAWQQDDTNLRSTPSDYDTNTHWNLEKIKAPEAWYNMGGCSTDNSCGGTTNTIVAVLDTGVAYEDYTYDAGGSFSPVKIAGLYMDIPFDDNQNGTVNEGYDRTYQQAPQFDTSQFVAPYDMAQEYMCNLRSGQTNANHRCNQYELAKRNHPNDDHGHGTFVTNIIAGLTDDAATNKIVGIAHNIKIMPVKVFTPNDRSMCQDAYGNLDLTCTDPDYDYRTVATTYTLSEGVDYAVANGADVINMSLGGEGTDPFLENAINDAVSAGIPVVVAAGNYNDNIDNYFPASFNSVITVGATNENDQKASYSNYGADLDLVAPVGDSGGLKIGSLTFSFFPNMNSCSDESNTTVYQTFTSESTLRTGIGTSYAAPQVSAAIGLIKSLRPSLTPDEIYILLTNTTTPINGTFNYNTGYGLLDIKKAIENIDNIEELDQRHRPSANGDKLTDIIAYSPLTRAIDVTPSTGTNFGGGYRGFEVWNSSTGYNEPDWQLLKPADVDGDGDKDIIAFQPSTTKIDVTLSDGSSFGGGYKGYEVWNYKTFYSTKDWVLLDPADVNGDNMADIIAYNFITSAVDVTLSTGTNFGGGYGNAQIWNSKTFYSTKDWDLLPPADVNGDNMADIIAYNFITSAVDVTLSTGTNFGGGYGNAQIWNYKSFYSTKDWSILSPADVNGDNMADIIAFNFITTAIDVTLSDGSTFGGGYGNAQVWNSRSSYSTKDWKLLN